MLLYLNDKDIMQVNDNLKISAKILKDMFTKEQVRVAELENEIAKLKKV